MILILSLAVAILFATGAYLMLKQDLVRLIIGMVLIGNAANLFIMSAGLRGGDAPLVHEGDDLADPLVQAMTLTAIVISFAISVLVLSLAYRVYTSHASVDMRELSQAEEAQAGLDDRPDADEMNEPFVIDREGDLVEELPTEGVAKP